MPMKKRFYHVEGQMVGCDEGGVRKDFLTDHLGSIIAEVDQDENVTYQARYSAYGQPTSSTGTGCGFGWVGTHGYRETGLPHMSHYVRTRHYSQVTGNWSTVDPLWPGESAYGYVGGRVTIWSDYYGTQRGCPMHTSGRKCVYSGPPGSESDPAYWHCSDPQPERGGQLCVTCLWDIRKRGLKAYGGGVGFENAMRHCVGACLSTQECGQVCADLVIIHEFKDWFSQDSRNDRHNNDVGFGIGKETKPKADCHKRCGEKWREGKLR
jgi:RHS repeat-associated protein